MPEEYNIERLLEIIKIKNRIMKQLEAKNIDNFSLWGCIKYKLGGK